MNKLFKSHLLSLGLAFLLVGSAFAAASVRGAKGMKTTVFTATAVAPCSGPGVVYSILTSSAAVGDFVVLRDSGTANTTSTIAAAISPSATLASQVTFDPPLQFKNGISINQPATNNWSTVTYECGKVVQGY
jgi:hypothetical protein